MGSGQSVPETKLEPGETGLVPAGEGWFVVNAREARWIERKGRGFSLPFTGWTGKEAATYFPQLGVALVILRPGEPIGMYHWEADQEDFLLLSGEAFDRRGAGAAAPAVGLRPLPATNGAHDRRRGERPVHGSRGRCARASGRRLGRVHGG